MKKKIFYSALAIVLIVVISVGATLAFVKEQKAPITNTFVAGSQKIIHGDPSVNFTLTENGVKKDANGNLVQDTDVTVQAGGSLEYTDIVPGMDIPKNPKLKVDIETGAIVYVFVKIEPTSLNSNLSWAVNDAAWTAVSGVDNVYVWNSGNPYTGTDALEIDGLSLLKDNQVVVADNAVFTPAEGETTVALGSLAVSAYVCQAQSFANAAAAWADCFA